MKKRFLLKTMLLLCALVAGSSSVWATDRTITVSYSGIGSDGITGTSWGTSYVAHRWTGESSDGTTVIYMGGTAAKQSNAFAIKNTASHILGNIDPSYDASTEYEIPTGVVGAIPGKIKKIEVSFISSTASGRGVYIHAGTSQIVTNEGAATGTGIVKSDKLSNNSGEDVSVEYDVTETAYTYFAITGANSSYTGISSYKITYEEVSTDPSSDASFTETEPSINFPATTTYTQAANTAAEYTGTVTYEITANTAGATLEGTTLTVTQEGSVTVKATAPAITGWTKSEATYTLTVNDTRSANGLAFATATQDVVVGEVLAAPTLTNPNSLPVTYSSLDETVATVDASGNVTGVKIGSTTIKATFAGDGSYKAGSVSYTINVTKAPFVIEDGVFDFTVGEDYGSKLAQSGVKDQTSTWTAVNVTMYMAGRNCWYNSTPPQVRLYKASGDSDAGSITLSVPSGYVITNIEFTGASFNKMSAETGTYKQAGTTATWEGVANSIKFTASDRTDINTITVTYGTKAPVTVTDAGWASFSCEKALDFTGTDVTAYIAKYKDESTVTLTEIKKVPANTGIVVRADEDTYEIPFLSGDADDTTGNLLKPWLTAGEPTEASEYYTLAAGPSFMESTGGILAGGKAYLVMPDGSSAPSLGVDFEGATSITTTNFTNGTNNSGAIFNLNGQRVTQPTKGLYIVNGKKYVVK